VVLPDQPFALDFSLIPAATLEGAVGDAQNPSDGRQRVYLCGDEVASFLQRAGLRSTRMPTGRFQFNDVPPKRACGQLPDNGHREARTVTMADRWFAVSACA